MFKRLFRVSKKENGQAIAELAIILPVLLILLCGIIDISWVSYNKLTLSYCSREGARYGIVHAQDANAVQQVVDRVLQVAPGSMRDTVTVTVTYSNVMSPSLGDISVRVSAVVENLTPVMGSIFSGDVLQLSSECVMKVE